MDLYSIPNFLIAPRSECFALLAVEIFLEYSSLMEILHVDICRRCEVQRKSGPIGGYYFRKVEKLLLDLFV